MITKTTLTPSLDIEDLGPADTIEAIDVALDRYDRTEIRRAMNLWRNGFDVFPTDYIELHELLARRELAELVFAGGAVYHVEIVDNGWLDGMRVVEAIVALPSGRFTVSAQPLRIRWSDSTVDRGAWYLRSSGGGQVILGNFPELVTNRDAAA